MYKTLFFVVLLGAYTVMTYMLAVIIESGSFITDPTINNISLLLYVGIMLSFIVMCLMIATSDYR